VFLQDVKLPDGTPANCDKKKLPTADHDRGKDYNHSTFIDLIIEVRETLFARCWFCSAIISL
jgi:hypothetical protein